MATQVAIAYTRRLFLAPTSPGVALAESAISTSTIATAMTTSTRSLIRNLEPAWVEFVDRVPVRVERVDGLQLIDHRSGDRIARARCWLDTGQSGLLEQDGEGHGDRVDAEHAHALECGEDLVAGCAGMERGTYVTSDAGFVAMCADGVEGDADEFDPFDWQHPCCSRIVAHPRATLGPVWIPFGEAVQRRAPCASLP